MQSFLIDTTSFEATARVLDNKRLHKQALEAWQCLMTMTKLDPNGEHRDPKGWNSHPVVKMWRGYETALVDYIQIMVTEWKGRGYKSTIGEKTDATYRRALELDRVSPEFILPPWMRDNDYYSRLCSTHRTALLCKNYEWYSQFDWPEDAGTAPDTYEYLWPHLDGFAE